MPSFIVMQPNGMYAQFSTVVDDFTAMDMTRAEALEELRQLPGIGVVEAEAKVKRAEEEEACSTVAPDEAGRPLARWLGCLGDVEFRHGRAVREQRATAGATRVDGSPPAPGSTTGPGTEGGR